MGAVIPKSRRSLPRLVMEDGGTCLHDLLVEPPEQRPLSAGEQGEIAWCVLHHVLALWRVYRLVHLDLKPQNIMVGDFRRPPKRLRVWLVDWGTSATLQRLQERPLLTHVTTRWFEAPEALLGLPQVGLPQDKWSLGVVLWAVCFHGEIPATGANYISHFWDLCHTFGTPAASDAPWCTVAAARRAVRDAPRWPPARARGALSAKRDVMNGILAGLGDLVLDGLLQMDPRARWSTAAIAARFPRLRLPPRQAWRIMREHPVAPWQPTQRAASRLMARHAAEARNPTPVRETRALLLRVMLSPINRVEAVHPMLPVFAMHLLHAIVQRLLPLGWHQCDILKAVHRTPAGAVSVKPSSDARALVHTCLMIAFKWFCDVAVDADMVARLFREPKPRRAVGRMVELERDVMRACPDILGFEALAGAYRKLERRLARAAQRDIRVVVLGSALLMHVMLFLPALWRFTPYALVRDIELIQLHILADVDAWTMQPLEGIGWLRSRCDAAPMSERWFLRHDIDHVQLQWVHQAFLRLIQLPI